MVLRVNNPAELFPHRTISPYGCHAARAQVRRKANMRGFVVTQSLELNIWLGLAVLALVSAQVLLWRTRHILGKARQEALVQDAGLAPVAVLVPLAVADSAVSGVAS